MIFDINEKIKKKEREKVNIKTDEKKKKNEIEKGRGFRKEIKFGKNNESIIIRKKKRNTKEKENKSLWPCYLSESQNCNYGKGFSNR